MVLNSKDFEEFKVQNEALELELENKKLKKRAQ